MSIEERVLRALNLMAVGNVLHVLGWLLVVYLVWWSR